VGGLGYLSSTYNRVRLGSNPRRRIMNIEDIMKQCRFIMANKTRNGDDRCFFEDETNKILYIFGPSHYIRSGFDPESKTDVLAIDFEGGPYIGIGDEVLSGKYAINMGLTYDHGVPVASVHYESKPPSKSKKKKKKSKAK